MRLLKKLVITAPMNYNEYKTLFCGVYPQVRYFAFFWNCKIILRIRHSDGTAMKCS